MIRVVLPHHLRTLARVGDEVHVDLNGSVTVQSLLDALEAKYPMLRGTIRDHESHKRRPMVRFFVCGEDVSHNPPDNPLPDAIAEGADVMRSVGVIAQGLERLPDGDHHDADGVARRTSGSARAEPDVAGQGQDVVDPYRDGLGIPGQREVDRVHVP